MSTYTTKQGDTWDLISLNLFGSVSYMTRLIALNKQYADIVFFSSDIEIIVPDIKQIKSTRMPPWRTS